MSEGDITILVAGRPIPQPRPRCVCVKNKPRIYHSGKAIEEWRRKVRAAIVSMKLETITGPVNVRATFNLMRPLNHYEGRNQTCRIIKSSFPVFHVSKPDLDNLIKPVLDEMKLAKLIKDDSQLVKIEATKSWCKNSPNCILTIRDLEKYYDFENTKEGGRG